MKGALKVFLIVVALASSFVFGFGWRDFSNGNLPEGAAFARLMGDRERAGPSATQIFAQQMQVVRRHFYRPVDPDRLRYAAMEGLFGSLGDPHTVFMSPVAARAFADDTRGDFVGVGARLAPDPLGARVINVFDDGPAARAGVRAGDTIIGVDGQDVGGATVESIVDRVRGERGTTVRLRLLRPGATSPIEFPIRRAQVIVPTAEGQILTGTGVGYVSVSQFTQSTREQFDAALTKVMRQKPMGLIIDLRGNPGGLLEVAAEMLGRFVDGKTVVTMKNRDGRDETVRTPRGETIAIDVPVLILVNEQSASAAEIFAGVMRDYQMATLIGEHTYGKASVQQVFPLVDMSSAKITVARYFLPGGEDISRRQDEEGTYLSGGVKPQVEVKLQTGDPVKDDQIVIGDLKTDPQLQRAVQMIRSGARSGRLDTVD